MLVKLIPKGEYDYTLKHEREGYVDKRLTDLKAELEDLEKTPEKFEEIEFKKEEIKIYEKFAAETKRKLEEHGPTLFRIVNIKEKDVIIAAARHNIPITDRKNAGQNIMSGILSHSEIKKLTAYDMGFRGYKNLRDENGELIPDTDKDIILQVRESLPSQVKLELGAQIIGEITEEEAKN